MILPAKSILEGLDLREIEKFSEESDEENRDRINNSNEYEGEEQFEEGFHTAESQKKESSKLVRDTIESGKSRRSKTLMPVRFEEKLINRSSDVVGGV